MPNRILREGILTSPRITRLGWAEEVFYRRLHSVVDDFGRYFADAGLLRAACYPRQLGKVTDPDIGKWLASCEAAGLVRVYPAEDGESYVQVLNFGQQIRAKKSKFPDPPSTCIADAKQTLSNGEASAHLDVSVSVFDKPPQAAAKRSRKVPLPDDFVMSERVTRWAEEKGYSRAYCKLNFEAFVSYAKRNGKTYADWDEALMTALRDNWAKAEASSTADYTKGALNA